MKIVADSRDRSTWLAARMNYVCSSECAAMLGESKYQDRAALVMAKAGLAEPWLGSETTRHGQYMEESYFPLAAKREFGWELEPFGLLVEDTLCPQLAATPDFIMTTPYGRALVQTKATTSQAAEDCKPRKNGSPSEAAYAGGAPLFYQIQQTAELVVHTLSCYAAPGVVRLHDVLSAHLCDHGTSCVAHRVIFAGGILDQPQQSGVLRDGVFGHHKRLLVWLSAPAAALAVQLVKLPNAPTDQFHHFVQID